MFSIGQHVIHPGQGVCTVVGFRDDTPQPMLLLETKQGHAQTILMYPVAQADRMHAAISQQDAEHLLSHYDERECDTFTERNSSLEETHFKQQLKLGAPETVRVAKTMMHRIRQAEEADKKPEMEDEIIDIITQGNSKENMDLGKEILAKYNYKDNISFENEVIIYKSLKEILIINIIVISILLIFSLLLSLIYFRKI